MTRKTAGAAVAAVALGLAGGIVVAQDLGEVTVQGTRLVTTKMLGKTASGVPVSAVSLGYALSTRDLDLATHAGYLEAQKRVNDMAEAACKELGQLYPDSTPGNAECAKAAAERAMVVVNGWAARASKAAAK